MSLLYGDYEWKTNRTNYCETSNYNMGYNKGLDHAQIKFEEALNKAQTIVDVKFNPPATIIFWGDGQKTVVKCGENEVFDPEKGLAMAYCKKMMGNKGRYYEQFKKWLPDEEKSDDILLREISNKVSMLANKKLASLGDVFEEIHGETAKDIPEMLKCKCVSKENNK